MKKFLTISLVFIFMIILFMFFACRSRSIGLLAPEPTATYTFTRTPTHTPTATPIKITGLIDNFSDCDGSNAFGGWWFAYGYTENTFTNPPPVITPGYAGGSDCAIKFEGNAAISCDYGVWMVTELLSGNAVDLRDNSTISFYAKGSGSYKIVLISLATQYNDYQYVFSAPSNWSQIVIPFSSFTQPGTGVPVSREDALAKVTRIAWANGSCNMTIELYVDDLKVY